MAVRIPASSPRAVPARAERVTAIRWSECDAAGAAARLRARPGLVWLDSALEFGRFGRWSIVASDPRWTVTADGSSAWLEQEGVRRSLGSDPIAALAAAIEREAATVAADGEVGGLPFTGGAVGYLGFELARHIERLPATTVDDTGCPRLAVGWYDAAVVWDHRRREGWLAGRAAAVEALAQRLRAPACAETGPAAGHDAGRSAEFTPPAEVRLRGNFTHRQYLRAVERARSYIAAGDIYQVNLSQRFTVPSPVPGFDLYGRLRAVSPAPFAAYLALGGVQVLSSSPERLLLADGEWLETRPVKGTRPRGATAAEDARLAAELLASAKDAAEHVMIVDLERNDLGRISQVGSVRVDQFAVLERFAQVHHLTSSVVGQRRPEVDLATLLRAVFPGGSISGAPKIRALEIIDELEPTARGVYTGAIGYWSAHGRMDLNVAIRTITLRDGLAHMQVGGAIVHDSDPQAEYRETMDKARGMARALGVLLPDERPAGRLARPPASAPASPVPAAPAPQADGAERAHDG